MQSDTIDCYVPRQIRFAQLTAFLNRTQFNNYVRKYDGNRYVKHFTCWNQLLVMMFGQLSNRESLRDLIVAFEAQRSKQYHLGLGREPIAKTTLASANQNRDYRIFEDFAFYMMKEACEKRSANLLDIPGKKYALIQRPFLYASQHFHGQDSGRRKAVLKPMSYMTLRLKFQPSIR